MKVVKSILCVFLSFIVLGGVLSLFTPGNMSIISIILLCVFILLDAKLIKSIRKQKQIILPEPQQPPLPEPQQVIDEKPPVSLNIKYNSSNPQKTYEVNDAENKFFESLFSKALQEHIPNSFNLTRMSDGTISVDYGTFPIGKIRLQSKKHYMFIFKSIYDYTQLNGTVDDFITHQYEWLNYLKKYIMKEGHSMKNICPICGNVAKSKIKVADGVICAACTNLTPYYATETIDKLKQYQFENQKRKNLFNQTNVIKGVMGDSVFIDDNSKLFYIGNAKTQNPQYYYFSEISDYTIERIDEKTVTKSKGGIGRAVVGGALFGGVGAVVGATTSKKETKNIGGQDLLKITINHPFGTFSKQIFSPPLGFSTFLDKCINQNNKPIASEADELLKFKKLLDDGIITQEEFEIKKKQILGL